MAQMQISAILEKVRMQSVRSAPSTVLLTGLITSAHCCTHASLLPLLTPAYTYGFHHSLLMSTLKYPIHLCAYTQCLNGGQPPAC
jgi:hypothetical protein